MISHVKSLFTQKDLRGCEDDEKYIYDKKSCEEQCLFGRPPSPTQGE